MGMFDVAVRIANPKTGQSIHVDAWVDTGAIYSVVPASVLENLGIEKEERREFTLANGRKEECHVGQAEFRIKGKARTSPVVFGREDVKLLGAVSLETLGLIADTTNKELIPASRLHLIGMR